MSRWLTISGLTVATCFILGGCSSKSSQTLYEIAKSGSTSFSLSDAGLVYNSSSVRVSATDGISLLPQYTTLYDFNSGADQGWTSQITATGGSFASGPTFTGNNLAYTSQTDYVGLAISSSTQSDYVMVADFSASAFDGANTLSLCLRMQSNLDDHYRLTLASGTLDISSRATSAYTSLGTAALALTPVTGTTYRLKATASGSTLGFRVWEASSTEPTSDQLTVTDATYSSGYPCLMMQAGQTATYDNIRIGSTSYTSDYVKTDPTVVFPAVSVRAGLKSFSTTITASGSDDIRFDLSLDGGSTFLYWDGSAWSTNSSGRSLANSLAVFSANLPSLKFSSSNIANVTVKIRAHIHSELGYTTPTMTAPVLYYK